MLISAAAAAKSLQSCPTLCDSIDRSPPGSPIPGILQARILEWVAISFSNAYFYYSTKQLYVSGILKYKGWGIKEKNERINEKEKESE